jgi:uncharacterized membrane protein YkoI
MNHMKLVATVAVALGVAAGSYGIASAADSSGSSSSSWLDAANAAANTQSRQGTPQGWGTQRSDETPLTGDTAAKVRAAAVAKEPGATVSRVETDADGNAAYEVHMVRSDGTPVTVYVDKEFNVVSVQTGMPGGAHGAPPQQSSGTA